tara:strand:+ start:29 stop:838 length:810 start_codon:yes stop_codon:yes gene_type:complete
VQDEPIRVEVIAGEEIEEKAIMRPGNIAMLVNETGGVRIQVTSPALGAANIRIQGLEGRYTQLLADNLPLYGGQASSLGLLQIPPTDLGQVEVIKGSASALYGASALGGVINLISKRPRDEFEAEVLGSVTTRGGQDLTAYAAAPLNETTGLSLTAGAHLQSGQDLDGDGWYDMAAYDRADCKAAVPMGRRWRVIGLPDHGRDDRRPGGRHAARQDGARWHSVSADAGYRAFRCRAGRGNTPFGLCDAHPARFGHAPRPFASLRRSRRR